VSKIDEKHGILAFSPLFFPFENEMVNYTEKSKNNDI